MGRVGQVAGADGAGGLLVVVGVVVVNGAVGDVALLLFDGHEANNRVRDLLLVELRLAALVEIAGGCAKLFAGQVVEGLLNHDITGAQSVAVEGASDASAERGALVNVGLEGQPGVMLAGGVDFGIPFAGGIRRKNHIEGGAEGDSAPLRVESGGFEVGGKVAAVLLPGVGSAAFGGELAARVLPAFAGIIPVKAELGELAADGLGGLLGERHPNPLADNLGQVVRLGQPLAEKVENLLGSKSAILFALLEIHIREYAGRLGLLCRFRLHRSRCSVLTDRVREPLLDFLCIFGFHAFFCTG